MSGHFTHSISIEIHINFNAKSLEGIGFDPNNTAARKERRGTGTGKEEGGDILQSVSVTSCQNLLRYVADSCLVWPLYSTGFTG